ncbi:uncharacterized protein YbbK (DUF523 family) [Pullulanibacillus pueri]|uniref:DUF523 domain-containing protein n=1 Tax=Pullulanibacillus pueri TaxID=1437324 RepID=A0A8J3EM06_9BACL|nr:DUF523 domain-containing protein [Pullulanibacillus pueri]MBM7680904.1 uncharacterized protein YbbK (DUF523 family) [Pullulanibacillus pueri]GGH81274.1 hypothetical protein GCM10007096_18930 [Pullulanibacillus pueri]
MILVSSCLAGLNVRYNGSNSLNERIQQLIEEKRALPICPELLGGFSTPREPAEIKGGSGEDVLDGKARVIEKSGTDVTDLYIKGAYATLERVRKLGVTAVVLKENSPSCGSTMIYNGDFSGKKVSGNGVTAALLKRNGIQVVSENGLDDLLEKG